MLDSASLAFGSYLDQPFRLVGNITISKDLLREISARDERW
jgi:hypothetical protein